MTSPPTALPVRAAGLALVLICLALGAASAAEARFISINHGSPLPWATVMASSMPRWLLLAASLPFALWLATRMSLGRAAVTAHLATFLAVSAAHAAVVASTMHLASPVSLFFPWPARMLRAWYGSVPILVALYGGVLAAGWALKEARERELRSVRASQLETQLQVARLAALRARLQPHFLYNTLNGIAALVADHRPDQAVAAIEQLSELLHASLRDDGRDVIPLGEEVALAERYLELQRMRFGSRLACQVRVAPDVAAWPVPILLLQPVVENAVVHGLEAGQKLQLAIAAERIASGLELRVENDGPTPDAAPRPNGHGVGLAATRARLVTAYGDRSSLELTPRPGGGAAVVIRIPAANGERPGAGTTS